MQQVLVTTCKSCSGVVSTGRCCPRKTTLVRIHSGAATNLTSTLITGMSIKTPIASQKFRKLTNYSIWDAFRVQYPLLTIIDPSAQSQMVRSLVDIYKHEGWLPDCRMSL